MVASLCWLLPHRDGVVIKDFFHMVKVGDHIERVGLEPIGDIAIMVVDLLLHILPNSFLIQLDAGKVQGGPFDELTVMVDVTDTHHNRYTAVAIGKTFRESLVVRLELE